VSSTRAPLVRPPGVGPAIGVVGDVYRFLAIGEETGGKYATIDALVPPGGGPPPHIHSREEESFYILAGEITFRIAGERVVAGAGTFANIPIGVLHSFKNESNTTARMIISVAPAGLERMFLEIGQPVEPDATSAPAPTKADIDRLIAAAPRYGVELKLGP
jgi:quercetin dioxygenase-like cupin family protein